MKRIISYFFFFTILTMIIYSFDITSPNQFPIPPIKNIPADTIVACDSTLWNHVYDPSRLTLVQNCIEITGIVWEKPVAEGDADYHISIRLDSGQAFYLNQKNYELKDSCLVAEVICAVKDKKHKDRVKITLLYRLLYNDLPEACESYYNKIYIPKKGEHVKVRGPLIIDEGEYSVVEHGWQEIHPVNSIELIK